MGLEKVLRKIIHARYLTKNNKHESIMEIIDLIEQNLGKKANINFMGMQPGDVKGHLRISIIQKKS